MKVLDWTQTSQIHLGQTKYIISFSLHLGSDLYCSVFADSQSIMSFLSFRVTLGCIILYLVGTHDFAFDALINIINAFTDASG